jgi:hypothetical protein
VRDLARVVLHVLATVPDLAGLRGAGDGFDHRSRAAEATLLGDPPRLDAGFFQHDNCRPVFAASPPLRHSSRQSYPRAGPGSCLSSGGKV